METTYKFCIDEIEKNGKYPEKGKKVIVIGAGVMGLCCAILSKFAGYDVEVYSENYSPDTTSDIAGAFFKPFLSNEDPNLLKIAKENFRLLSIMLSNIEKEGSSRVVDWIHGFDYSRSSMEDPAWKNTVLDFKRVEKKDLPLDYKDGYYYKSILCEVPVYMKELNVVAKKLGIPLHKRKIENFPEFVKEVHSDNLYAIFNCAGLGSRFLFNDQKTYPIAGQVVKIQTKDYYHKKWFFFNNDMDKLAYVIMRSDCIVLGGSANEHDWNTTPNNEFTKEIIRRCQEVTPEEHVPKTPKILDVKVGLRPHRDNLRVEKEFVKVNKNGKDVQVAVIHNYGHSGSGWTLHLGSCKEALLLLKNAKSQPKL